MCVTGNVISKSANTVYGGRAWFLKGVPHRVCRALLRSSALPEERRQELLATVAEQWGCGTDDVTEEMIKMSSEIDTR